MIKNNRPFTNENGFEDAELFTQMKMPEIKKIGKWIQENIQPSETEYPSSSYGLKHVLERDIGIYMTNNQFKDAMWLAGYVPIDANELNWNYNIKFNEPENRNPFIKWVAKYGDEDSPIGDFASDTLNDKDFPVFADYKIILHYLDHEKHACKEAIEAFKELWNKFDKQNKGMYTTRLLTLAEVQRKELHEEYLWVEVGEELYRLQIYCHSASDEDMDACCNFDIPDDTYECSWNTYGKTWRCWKDRPTFEQMENTPWE